MISGTGSFDKERFDKAAIFSLRLDWSVYTSIVIFMSWWRMMDWATFGGTERVAR
jgi:hypothetical protein